MIAAPLLRVEGVDLRFGGLHALAGVSFAVERGELIALIGPNGAGKTTLLNVIAGALPPSAGEIAFKGEAITGEPAHRINARGIARTFQAAELIEKLTVRENVMAGGVAASGVGLLACLQGIGPARRVAAKLRRAAEEYLGLVGLEHRADDPAASLPAGQQRLLGIARALATGAELLILDEPAAGLNETEKKALGAVILKLSAAGKTVIFVEHDMPLVADLARRIIVLDRGRIIADGPPSAVRTDPRVVEAYLGRPADAPVLRTVPRAATVRTPLLRLRDVTVAYVGQPVLDIEAIDINEGEIVALVGANGAGKSSLLKTIARVGPGRAGEISFAGTDLSRRAADGAVLHGISLVPEGRHLFPSLTVADNLAVGRYAKRRSSGFHHLLWQSSEEVRETEALLATVYELFPVLAERREQIAGTLSGGQGQMLAIGRALMAKPRLLMLDEPSLGLAPQVTAEIMNCLVRLRGEGLTILLVEQNARAALEIADRAFVLATGRIVVTGTGHDLLNDPQIASAYLGDALDGGGPSAMAVAQPLAGGQRRHGGS